MDISTICISKEISIIQAMRILDDTNKKILLVVEANILVGVVTDGDVRRWILKNGNLEESVFLIMNMNPIFLYKNQIAEAKKIMQEKMVEAVPIVDYNKQVIDIIFWNDEFEKKFNYFESLDCPVVIMAGGKGTRLYPYTKVLPKPLIPIGDITIVERIIKNFTDYGCNSFFLTLNYKKNLIKAYFSDVKYDYELSYVEESQYLGTAGSLYLLKDKIDKTFFVSNCDILIDANYSDIVKYHKASGNKITMVTSLKNYIIPYGIIKTDDKGQIQEMQEKPTFNFQVNTGLYVLEPQTIKDIPENTFFHITDLIDYYIKKGEKVGMYPVTENAWMDMGQINEMNNMISRIEKR